MATRRSRLLPVPGVWEKVRLDALSLPEEVVAAWVTVSVPPLKRVAAGLARVAKVVVAYDRVVVMEGFAGSKPPGTYA